MSVQKNHVTEHLECCENRSRHCIHAGKKILMTLLGILMVYAIIFLGTTARNNIRKFYRIGWADKFERSINIQAEGKATAIPDIAKVEMGTLTNAPTVALAQKKNTEIMNNLIAKLKDLGITKNDIQTTEYTINPQYNYTQESGSVLTGYEVRNSVKVKIRDLTKAGDVLDLAGTVGANLTGGLQFEVDDLEVYRAQARIDAMKKLADKIGQISQTLGVRFMSVTSYSEYDNGQGPNYPIYYAKEGMGGGAVTPNIETGSKEVILNVNVTFEIR